MAQNIGHYLEIAGYKKPNLILTRTAWMCSAFALATAAGRLFDSNLHVKSHLTFGQVTALTFNLLCYNRYLEKFFTENKDPQKKDVLDRVFFLMLCVIPPTLGRMVTNRCFESISWIQAGKRGLYFWAFGGATFCGFVLYQRSKKK